MMSKASIKIPIRGHIDAGHASRRIHTPLCFIYTLSDDATQQLLSYKGVRKFLAAIKFDKLQHITPIKRRITT
ncbi:hypothetical protein ASF12_27515 [Paenibacillus sp. Leaf72]|nr:hypothetical protein ASF12_27515 [Paenibacillus sp. Leaf72]